MTFSAARLFSLVRISTVFLILTIASAVSSARTDTDSALIKVDDIRISSYDSCPGCDPLVTPDTSSALLDSPDANSYISVDIDPETSEGNHCDDTHCNCAWTGCNNFAQQCAGYGYTSIACVTEVTKDGYPIGFGCECSGPAR